MAQEELEIINCGVHSPELGKATCHVPGSRLPASELGGAPPPPPPPALLSVSRPTSSHLALSRLHASPYFRQSRIQRPWEIPELGREAAV